MKPTLFALLLALAVSTAASAQSEAEWGKVDREELFATHFPEAPYADAVVLLDHAIARVDSKDHLKYYRHHRTKIFKETAYDRGVVRIPIGKGEEIRDFRAQTIVPPGHLVEVGKDGRHEETLPDGSKVLVVEFPSLQPGVVLEYEYQMRRDELHTIPVWPFRQRDFTRASRFELMIPEGMSYDASFSWVPGLVPRPQIRMINDPEEPSLEVKQVAWELTNQAALQPVPMSGDPERYQVALYVQLGEFSSTYRNFTVRRTWGEIGNEVAAQHAAFAKDTGGASQWVKAAALSGDEGQVAADLHHLVCAGIKTDLAGPDVATSTMSEMVLRGAGTPTAKNVLLAHLLREQGIPADVVMIRAADHGPLQPKYISASQLDHAIVRAQIGGATVWTDAGYPCGPFGLLPPASQVDSGLRIAENGASGLVDVPKAAVASGRTFETKATFDKNGTLLATSTIHLEGWNALEPRRLAARDGGRGFAESILRARFGDAAVLDSFEVGGLEETGVPLTIEVAFRVADYAHRSGDKLTLRVPYLTSMERNPLLDEDREVPVVLGFAGTTEEQVTLTLPEEWGLPEAPARGSARSSDLRYQVAHAVDGAVLRSTRTFKVKEPTVSHDAAAALRGLFDKIVASDTSELTLQRQSLRASSAR